MAQQQMGKWLKSISLAMLIAVAGVVPSQKVFANPEIIAQADTAEQLVEEAFELFQEGSAESLRQTIAKLEQAVVLFRQAGERGSEALALLGLGGIYLDLGEKQEALEHFNQALPLFRTLGDRLREAGILIYLGSVHNSLGEKQQALEYFNQALPLFRALGYRSGEVATLDNLGALYNSLGEKQQALEHYNQALPLFRALGHRLREAATLYNLGALYNSLGEKQQALEHYGRALPLFRTLGHRQGEAGTLNDLSVVYLDLGENKEALEYLKQALLLFRALGHRQGEASVLNNLGLLYNSLGEKEQALEYVYQALTVYHGLGERSGEAAALSTLGGVYLSLGDREQALEYLNQALPLFRALGHRQAEAVALQNLGRIYFLLGDREQALEYYNQALSLVRGAGDRRVELSTQYNLADLERDRDNLETSLTHIQEAIAILEDLRTKIGSQDLRASFFATVQDYYQFYIDLLMELHQQNPNKGYDARALHISERSRARGLVELLAEANANIREGVDPQLLAQEQALLQQLNTVERDRHQLTSGQYSQEELDNLKQQSQDLLLQRDRLEAQIRTSSPGYANLKYPQPLTLKQIQEQVLDEDTLLLQYALGEERSFLWAVTQNGITSYVLPSNAEIATAAQAFRESLTSDNGGNLSAGEALSQIVLAPVAERLKGKRLVVVGDGILQYIPFSALPLPNTPDTPLLIQNEIVTLPSASTVAIQRQQLANRSPAPQTLALLADPIFDSNDPRLTGTPPPPNQDTLNKLALTRAVRSLGLGDAAPTLPRLEYTRVEGEKILALVPDAKELEAFDFQASRQVATHPKLSEYQIVHFATHGILDSTNPELSGVVLSLFDENQQPEDGFLRLQDIFNLNLPAELVVLSACQTGLGENVRGEGIVGLTRGFMYAGARRVVVSLWSVNDVATSEVMVEFYQNMLEKQQNPVTALRQAQLEMWNSSQRKSPYYWAAFTIQGDWQ